jgi:UDP-2,3-diacylglucosamine hydrolase
MTTLFISDLHLTSDRPASTEQLEALLKDDALGTSRMYILGDLFEYWAGDDDIADPFNQRVVGALANAAARFPIHFMPGNRDFLAGEAFLAASRMQPAADPTVIRLGQRRTLLTHGDALCTDDVDYQRFRAESRSAAWKLTILSTPLDLRKRHIQTLREQSEAQKRVKSAGIMDVNQDAVADAFREDDCTLMIHGHTHRPGHHVHRVDGRDHDRRVLDAWYEHGSYLAFDEASGTFRTGIVR